MCSKCLFVELMCSPFSEWSLTFLLSGKFFFRSAPHAEYQSVQVKKHIMSTKILAFLFNLENVLSFSMDFFRFCFHRKKTLLSRRLLVGEGSDKKMIYDVCAGVEKSVFIRRREVGKQMRFLCRAIFAWEWKQ